MKQLLLISFLFASCAAYSQVTTPSATKMTDRELGLIYQKKGRNLRIAGFCMLGGGIILTSVGLNQAYSWDSNNSGGEALLIIGQLAVIGSIPCFIAAAKNKGRAEILLRNENVPLSFKHVKSFPALGIAVKL